MKHTTSTGRGLVITLLIATAAYVAGRYSAATRADEPAATTKPSDLGQLKKDHIQTLTRACDLANQLYSRGLLEFSNVGESQRMLAEAKLEYAATPKDRIDVLRESKDMAAKTHELTQSRFKAGLTSDLDVAMATANRLKIEILLTEELAK